MLCAKLAELVRVSMHQRLDGRCWGLSACATHAASIAFWPPSGAQECPPVDGAPYTTKTADRVSGRAHPSDARDACTLVCDTAGMIRIGSVVMNVSDTGRASEFWRQALGYVSSPDNPAFLAPEDGQGARLHLDDEDRMHLDLWAADEEDQLAEVERLVSLGARRVAWEYPEDADFVVLADPDGNLFCVIR